MDYTGDTGQGSRGFWMLSRLATVWSGLDCGFFWRLLKRLDCMVQSFVGLDWTVPKDRIVQR